MMKKGLLLFVFFWTVSLIAGCTNTNSIKETKEVSENTPSIIAEVIPLSERKFLYNNGIEIDYKESEHLDESKIKVIEYFPVINGLKNKQVQDKINKEIETVRLELLSKLEQSIKKAASTRKIEYNQKRISAYIPYNYNNVIFIGYSASSDARFEDYSYFPNYYSVTYGYDLNTGKRLTLKDLFKPDSDYKKKINNFICQYIIENNFDDYEAEVLTKPFQGIREDQSFYFDIDGLRIVIDEKNDEFVSGGNNDVFYGCVFIPIDYLGDDIFIFDKFQYKNKSLYEQEKLTKKLFPNQIEFRYTESLEEGNERYYIGLSKGEFLKVPDKDIEKKLNEMALCKYDIEEFKVRAKSLTTTNDVSHFGHFVSITLNAGGLLSVNVTDEEYFAGKYQTQRTCFNYDFNQNKELQLQDLFTNNIDYEKTIKENIKKRYFPVTGDMLDLGVKEILSSKDFYFDESGVVVYFSPPNSKLDNHEKWIHIAFEEFGLENISFLN